MKLEIITPQKIVFSGNVNVVTLPGTNGKFTVLENHASLIASLTKGVIRYKNKDNPLHEYPIESGLCEVNLNEIYVCVEQITNEKSDEPIKQ
ncbi:MAG: ATP synthase F1 subunit epsilon [Paludibacter sp.]|nr:ATP synthase F1 subunit epsilon [Paludibacter sp.]